MKSPPPQRIPYFERSPLLLVIFLAPAQDRRLGYVCNRWPLDVATNTGTKGPSRTAHRTPPRKWRHFAPPAGPLPPVPELPPPTESRGPTPSVAPDAGGHRPRLRPHRFPADGPPGSGVGPLTPTPAPMWLRGYVKECYGIPIKKIE